MVKGQDLAVSLEEFGLSKYEAQAYVTLITKGTISASELAYYSDLPRTKVYPTLLKLEKKKIAIISKSKPIMCTAIAPEDAFDEIIQEQINRVNAMNSLTTKLKRLSEDSKKARGSEEKRYFHLAQNYVFKQFQTMIEGSKTSIHAIIDSWGLGLISQCKDELLVALRRNIDVKIIIPSNLVGTETFHNLPSEIKIKTAEVSQNMITFDDSEILMINSSNGKGAIFLSTDVLGTNQVKTFEHAWKSGIKVNNLSDMTKSDAQETLKVVQLVNENGLGFVLNSMLNSKGKGIDLMVFLEKNGLDIQSKTLDEIISLVDSTLDITCSGISNTSRRAITL
ncbi:Transcriptional regulator, TrmB family [Candidatus Nitrosotalea sp. TS]|uniref:TrmB family transcriptional regulator n=1 Tax=Candidatus Nitrosotalea sp. TS TaxID=2341020 RepID=UPI001EBD6434|nr:helix-turn-helix domain-containing protein [Candidatus Nitrosotalea sp. TS]NHI02508.1 Transcriptional regulator, TrmB family [Candidatus Nitrosotalea sp. TS]